MTSAIRPTDETKQEVDRDAAAGHIQDPWRLHILIVDDNEMDREWLASQARSMDEYQVDISLARNVTEATNLIKAKCFDIALVDYLLGSAYGDQITRLLNQADYKCATILISNHAMAEVSLYGVKAGATAALSKDDLSSSLLETTIRFALANRAKAR